MDIKSPDADCCKFTGRAHKVAQNDDSYLHSLRGGVELSSRISDENSRTKPSSHKHL